MSKKIKTVFIAGGVIISIFAIVLLSDNFAIGNLNSNETENQIKTIETKIIEKKEFEEENLYIKNLIMELQPRLDPKLAELFTTAIIKYSKEYDFPPSLIVCLINRESSFNPLAVSSANCVGLMQINPKAHKALLEKRNINYYQLSHIDNNISVGCTILKEYYVKHKGDIRKTLINYVGGTHETYITDILSLFASCKIKNKF